MDSATALALFDEVAAKITEAVAKLDDWGPAGTRPGQYRVDLAADEAAIAALVEAGVGVLSEESGRHEPDAAVTVVIDPIDGSTNAAAGIPWFATSLCAVDADGMLASLVVNQADGTRFSATRGGGATRNGVAIRPSAVETMSDAVVGLSGWPARHLGWRQFRALGAAALDLCAVASGVLDGFIDISVDAHGAWDYLGAALVCQEVGVPVVDALGRDLVVLDHGARRTPVAACTLALRGELVVARRSLS